MLLERVAGTILRYSMARRGQRIGVAVSGGADSVFLLHALVRLAPRLGVGLAVLHLNHGLRGAESDEDERFTLLLAASLGVEAHGGRVSLSDGGGNLEQAARGARLKFFESAKREFALDAVATGHTRSDQAETLLFRMARGTGAAGLRGILPVTGEGLIRPLLDVDRGEVRAWLAEQQLSWREDRSNQDTRLARNFLRLEVLPRLAGSVNPAVEAALARLAGAASEDEEYWGRLAGAELAALCQAAHPGMLVVDAGRLAACHPALGKRVVRQALGEIAGSLRRFTHEHVEAVWRLAAQPRGSGRVQLPRVEVRRSLSCLRFTGAGAVPDRAGAVPAVSVKLVDSQAVVRPALSAALCRYNVGSDLLDADKVSFPLSSRGWQAGDAYRPVGHGGEVKLKTLLASAGVPSWDRPGWPILLSAGRIVWCRRFGGAAWAVAGPECRRVLLVQAAGNE